MSARRRKQTPAALVRQLRAEAGLTQAELAERLGVAQPRVAEWESGTRNPRPVTLVAIRAVCAAARDERG